MEGPERVNPTLYQVCGLKPVNAAPEKSIGLTGASLQPPKRQPPPRRTERVVGGGSHGEQGAGDDLVAVAAAAAAAPRGGCPVLDPSGDRDGRRGRRRHDVLRGAEVAARVRGGAGELLLPVLPIRALRPLPILREGQPVLCSDSCHSILGLTVEGRNRSWEGETRGTMLQSCNWMGFGIFGTIFLLYFSM